MKAIERMARAVGLIALILIALTAAAQALSTPVRTGWVTDEAGILDPETASVLARNLAELQRRTGAEVIVVTLKSLQGASIDTWGEVLGESWNIGRSAGQDKGALLIVAPNDRKVRIAVGYGLGERLSDSTAAAIVADDILPSFRRGDFNAGIRAGIASITAQVDRRAAVTLPAVERSTSPVVTTTTSHSSGFHVPPMVILAVILLGLTLVVLIMWHVGNIDSGLHPEENAAPAAAPDPPTVPLPDPSATPPPPPTDTQDGMGGFLTWLLSNNNSTRNNYTPRSSNWSSSSWSSSRSYSSSHSRSSGRSWSGGSSSGGSRRSFSGGASGSW